MENTELIKKNLTNELIYLFNNGELYHAYRTFGAHVGEEGVRFTVWAPEVKSVRVTGDFNNWNPWGEEHVLKEIGKTGIWTGFVHGACDGQRYKLDIEFMNGEHVLKADPFAFGSEARPGTASVIRDFSYTWNDTEWLEKRARTDAFTSPMNIYEVHLGSWKRPQDPDDPERFYTYRELADLLVPYVKEMGYTHVEFLPVMEHPLDASWGYQVTGFYSPTARYGKAADLKYLIDKLHTEGIGVILDWVPGHFCPDAHGLANFNGNMLYECERHPQWGTYKFDFGRPQVRSFLLSNAMYWVEEYHADGLRVDGVSSMLYLNFGHPDDAPKKKNKYGGDGNLDAIEFLKEFNYMIGTHCKGVVTVAEESSAWPMVTKPPRDGGLGFHFKWNMGWMNDTLNYMSADFPYRSYEHNKLTFSMTYAYSENYILPLSHDEVVHGKYSLIGRMPGDYWRKFAGVRLLALYQMTHPGKKLNFMGYEIAQFIEWREYEQLEWFLLAYEKHADYHKYIRDLNHMYLEHPALWKDDASWEGFKWVDPDNREQGILTYTRKSTGTDDELLLVVINTGVQAFDEFVIGVPEKGYYKEIFNSDAAVYGGSERVNTRQVRAKKKPAHGMPYSITIRMPVIGGCIFKRRDPDKRTTNTKRKGKE